MKNVAVVTDSNSGITQNQAKNYGLFVIPMPFTIDGEPYLEDINLTQEEFYEKLLNDCDISTSQPSPGAVTELWDDLLKEYDELVYIPMSSGLSASCQTASVLAAEYGGKVQVVNNQRISVTLKCSVLDALTMAKSGKEALQIKEYLETVKFDSSIYITVNNLKYLKRGGRVTPAGAAIGTLLQIKPVLQIHGEKLDAFAKARGMTQARTIMKDAIRRDLDTRFKEFASPEKIWLQMAYTFDKEQAEDFKSEMEADFPGFDIDMAPLSLSISCHIGPGALAVGCTKKSYANL